MNIKQPYFPSLQLIGLDAEHWALLERLAARSGMPLRTYTRRVISDSMRYRWVVPEVPRQVSVNPPRRSRPHLRNPPVRTMVWRVPREELKLIDEYRGDAYRSRESFVYSTVVAALSYRTWYDEQDQLQFGG